MATFGSSIINKSGKRFAPKPGPRRSTSTSQTIAQSSSRASTERRTPSSTPNPTAEEISSTEQQGSSVHPIESGRPETRQIDRPSRGSKNVITPKPLDSGITQRTESIHSGKISQDAANAQDVAVRSRRAQYSDSRYSDQPLSPSDDAASTPSLLTRRSSRVRKDVPSSSDVQAPSRKRQRLGNLEIGQTVSKLKDPTRSLQSTYGRNSHLLSDTGESQTRLSGLEKSVENIQNQLQTPPATIHPPIHEVEDPSVAGTTKSIRRKSSKKVSTTDSRTSGRKDGVSRAVKLTQSQSQEDGQPGLENDSSDIVDGAQTDDIESSTIKRRRRRRVQTPEESEKVEIATAVVKMSELCRDLGTGKKSKRAEEIEKLDWTEIVRKQQERKARREAGELPPQETVDEALRRVREEEEVSLQLQQGPQMRLVNGQLVVDDASLQVDRHAAAAQSTMNFEEIEESELTRRVNSGTWMKREKTEVWTNEEISLLYQGMRMFGTDFEIISKMFPLRSRRQIKLRYTKEERINPNRVKQALSGKTTEMNLEEYSRLTDMTYEDPAIFNAEMERKRLEHDLEQQQLDEERAEEARKKREENETSVEPDEEDERNQDSQKENDVQTTTTATPSSTKPKKTKRKAKKPAVSKTSKKNQHSRKVAGEAEVLGPVEGV